MPAERRPSSDKAEKADRLPGKARACDQCHRRRAKCDGQQPCTRCGDRVCTYDRPLMRKGPEPGKRKRDRAVSDSMRPSSSPSSAPSTAAIPPAEPSSIEAAQALPTVTMGGATLSNDNLAHLFGENGFAFDIGNWLLPQLSLAAHGIPDVPPPPAASHTLLDPATLAFVLDLVPTFYERNVYIITLLPYAYIDARTHRGDHDTAPDFAALLVAMAANVLLHTVEAAEAFEGTRVLRARELLDLACRLKGSSACGVGVGIDAVLSSFLLFLCFFGIAEQDAAWYRLRESLTLAESMVTQQERAVGTADEIDEPERLRRSRLVGLLAVCERGYALKRHRPSISWRDAALATPDSEAAAGQDRAVRGLSLLLRVFTLIDTRIITCWNGGPSHDPATCGLTRETVIQLQRDFDNVYGPDGADVAPDPSNTLTESQRADLLVNQQWLKNRVFELSMAHGFIKDMDDEAMDGQEQAWELSPLYAVAIGNNTLALCRGLSNTVAEHNGLAWCEKLWQIGHTITEIAADRPGTLDTEVNGPNIRLAGRDTLAQLLCQITLFRAGQNPYIQRMADDIARVS